MLHRRPPIKRAYKGLSTGLPRIFSCLARNPIKKTETADSSGGNSPAPQSPCRCQPVAIIAPPTTGRMIDPMRWILSAHRTRGERTALS